MLKFYQQKHGWKSMDVLGQTVYITIWLKLDMLIDLQVTTFLATQSWS